MFVSDDYYPMTVLAVVLDESVVGLARIKCIHWWDWLVRNCMQIDGIGKCMMVILE